MSILLLMGSQNDLGDPEGVAHLASFCARLVREGSVSSCLAVLPAERNQLYGLLSFLQALQSAGIYNTAVMIRASELSSSLLLECDDAGIDEIVILLGVQDTGSGIEEMIVFRNARPGALPYRLWLDPDAAGTLQFQVRAWEYACPNPESIEVAPFTFQKEPVIATMPADQERAGFGCDWLRSVITIDSVRTITPCPAHTKQSGIAVAGPSARSWTEWQEKPERVTSSSTCRGCHRLVRFAIPEWLRGLREGLPFADATKGEEGHLGTIPSVLNDMAPPARDAAIAALIGRVAHSARRVADGPREKP